MGIEIERKFLVLNDTWRQSIIRSEHIVQGYLANTDRGSFRIRLAGDSGYLNLKSITLGVRRTEFEYPIPADDARQILQTLCMLPLIEKQRYYLEYGDHVWEIDEFTGENSGLIVAEIELSATDEDFATPPWLGQEVSDDPRYYNVRLVQHPYSEWQD